MWFELAWQFGMPVAVLMSLMPSYEFAEWKAWAKLRHEEFEAERAKQSSRAGMRGSTMGARRGR